MEFDDLSNRVIGCAIDVHREIGPGLLESLTPSCPSWWDDPEWEHGHASGRSYLAPPMPGVRTSETEQALSTSLTLTH